MTSHAPRLSAEILDRFREALRFAGAPLGGEIGPGLTDAEINRLGDHVGVNVPQELRTLWRWGTVPETQSTPDSWDINPVFELWPPALAITETKAYRVADTARHRALAFGGPSQDGYLLAEADAEALISRVIYARIDDPNSIAAAPSLGAIFTLWTEQLAAGDYKFVGDEWRPLTGPRAWISDVT